MMRKNKECSVIRTSEDQLQRPLRHIDLGNLMAVLRVDKDLPIRNVNVTVHIHSHALASSLRERVKGCVWSPKHAGESVETDNQR